MSACVRMPTCEQNGMATQQIRQSAVRMAKSSKKHNEPPKHQLTASSKAIHGNGCDPEPNVPPRPSRKGQYAPSNAPPPLLFQRRRGLAKQIHKSKKKTTIFLSPDKTIPARTQEQRRAGRRRCGAHCRSEMLQRPPTRGRAAPFRRGQGQKTSRRPQRPRPPTAGKTRRRIFPQRLGPGRARRASPPWPRGAWWSPRGSARPRCRR